MLFVASQICAFVSILLVDRYIFHKKIGEISLFEFYNGLSGSFIIPHLIMFIVEHYYAQLSLPLILIMLISCITPLLNHTLLVCVYPCAVGEIFLRDLSQNRDIFSRIKVICFMEGIVAVNLFAAHFWHLLRISSFLIYQ